MAQRHNIDYAEKPMTREGRIQGPSRRYRRLRHPNFPAAEWTAQNPLLQRGEIGVEIDTRRMKVGDGYTLWNDLAYASEGASWGEIIGTISDQTDLTTYVANAVSVEATLRENADTGLQNQITANKGTMDNHIANTSNPHSVTAAQVGLGNVDNTSDLNKPISTATQAALNNKQDVISDLATIRSDASAGKSASDTIATYGDIVTYNASDFATAAQGALADTAVQPADLATVATSGSYTDLIDTPTIPTVNNPTITITQGGVIKGSFTLNQSSGDTIALDAGGGAGHNVGDIFWTMRKTNTLNGAVECNGATYDTDDFEGAQSIGELLESGEVPYVTLADYATALTTDGVCGVFGWDGAGTTSFRVPLLQDIFIETGTATQIGDYLEPAIPNIKYGASYPTIGSSNNALTLGARTSSYVGPSASNNVYFYPNNVNASTVSSVYKDTADTVQPKAIRYRPMVQLAVGATDEALETCTNVLAMMANADFVIERQDPTAANNYTWYRKYKSGWVEQGGSGTTSSSGSITVTLPVTMTDNAYTLTTSGNYDSNSTIVMYNSKTTTDFVITTQNYNHTDTTRGFNWQVSGVAAS